MPTYDYRCTNCNEEFEMQLSIADRELPCRVLCPFDCTKNELTIERFLAGAPGVSYTAGGNSVRKKTPDAFKDVLRNIKSKHLHSTIDV
jgi:putative FmdB family regulatory protein